MVPNGNAKKSKFIIAFFLPVKLWFEILTFYAILGQNPIFARENLRSNVDLSFQATAVGCCLKLPLFASL